MTLGEPTPRPAVVKALVLPLLLTGLTVAGAVSEAHPTTPISAGVARPVPWPAYLLVVLAGLVLVWRWRRPTATLAVSLGAVSAYTALGYFNGAAVVSPVVALYYYVAARPAHVERGPGSRARARAAAGVTLVVILGLTAIRGQFGVFGGSLALIPGLVAVAMFAGFATADRRAYIDAIRQRAELLERTRDDEVMRRVDAERLRIARELHDVVAHTMATINVQAGAALHVTKQLADPVASSLAIIRDASKQGLRELRTILTVLRQADEKEPTLPTPGLADLGALVATAEVAGLRATVEYVGRPEKLSPAVELAVYRIVQESLTNAVRHAGTATATVRIEFADQRLSLEVADNGVGGEVPVEGVGLGLTGMRERAVAVGGTLDAGPLRHGGFYVRATLPVGTSG